MNQPYQEEITYHQFKNWIVQQAVSFILDIIPKLYVEEKPKKTLQEWVT